MPAVDPRDPLAVGQAVAVWASEHLGTAVELGAVPTAIAGGFDSYLHLVELAGPDLPDVWGSPLVVRIIPSLDRTAQAVAEAAVQSWCADRGYPAPRILAVVDLDVLGLPAQVMERAPGVTMLQALRARPWRARALVDQLAGLQQRLHALDPGGWPGAATAAALVDKRLHLARRAVVNLDDHELARALERAEALVPACTTGEPVVCHGDFHPLNVIVDGTSAAVIDWTDAGLGPREADVSRTHLLFHVAALAADNRLERVALRATGPRLARRYRAQYEGETPLDPERMRAWDALHALHGWAQIALLHAGAFAGESATEGSEPRIPVALAAWLRQRFDDHLA